MKHPVPTPFSNMLAEKLKAQALEDGELEFAVPGTKIRHSWAGSCSRKIWYHLDGVVGTPKDATTYYTFGIGTMLHERLQEVIEEWCEFYGHEAVIEKKIHNPHASSSGHIDASVLLRTPAEKRITLEIKTINGTGYRHAIGLGKSEPGPRWSAFVQGACNAVIDDADELYIVYLPLEVVSVSLAARNNLPPDLRHGATFVYTRDEFTPVAEAEFERWRWIVNAHEDGMAVPRLLGDPSFGANAVVLDPSTGKTDRGSKTWECDYCDFQAHCTKDQ